MPNHRDGSGRALAARLALAFSMAACAPSWAGLVDGAPSSCDPTHASCASGSPGPGSTCTPAQQALHLCQPPGTGNPGMCTPPSNGNPSCSGSGPASQGDGTGVQVGAGNPINLISGNKYQEETDLPALPGVLGLELKRYYNSLSSHPGLLGANWRISYETVLYDLGSQIQIVQADGRRLMFQRGVDGNAVLCSSATVQDGQVRIEDSKNGQGTRVYHWRWPDGRTLTFSGGSGGGYPLQAIAAASGERVVLTYSPQGELVQVRDPQGRKLEFIYANAADRRSRALKAIQTPLGRVSYAQDKQGRLVEVASSKDATSAPYTTRLYHYEDKYNAGHLNALTGVSIRGVDSTSSKVVEQRLSTYAYNAAGLAILSTKGFPKEIKDGEPVADSGIEQIEVQYQAKALPFEGKPDKASAEVTPRQVGRAILTNSVGQKTEVLSAVIGGYYRLIQMKGAGCSTCGPSNMRYAYSASGQLLRATKLDDNGQPMFSEVTQYDRFGRVVRYGRQVHGKGKSEPVRWTQRIEYADVRYADGSVAVASLPSLIARPSVIAGKERVMRFAYNPIWQPTNITDEGFSPVDEKGQPSPEGTRISRTTTYRYTSVNGRTLLAEIDGPLPNGQKNTSEDSDITRIEWDARGQSVVNVDYPGGLRAHIDYDDFGRFSAVARPSGATDNYHYDEHANLASISHRNGGIVIGDESYRRDALGRIIETSNRVEGEAVPRTRRAFDVAGRILWQADALGILRQAHHDSEDRLLSSRVFGAGVDQEERYTYDEHGRLRRVQDSTGASREIMRDETGRIAGSIDPLGRWTRFEHEPHVLRVIQAANTAKPLAVRYEIDERGQLRTIGAEASDGVGIVRSTSHQRVVDDFGREIVVASPDSGREVRRFDAADRIVQVLHPDGSMIDLEYDPAGRLVRRTATPNGIPAETARPQSVRYVYEGARLVQISDPEQTERYTYDELARVTHKTVTLTPAGGGEAVSTTRYRYDEQGLLAAQSLPDGSELQYERNRQRQIVALHRLTSAWAPFGWGRTTLVKDLQRDLTGLRSMRYGNGVIGHWQRSREGLLARVAYTSPRPEVSPLRTAFEDLMADARAQAPRPAQAASAPGAFGLPRDPLALWDSRLLFDTAGNIVVQAQFANSAVARPKHTALAYDAQNQLAQALQAPEHDGLVVTAAMQSPAIAWRYHYDSLGNRLLAQQAVPMQNLGATTKMAYERGSDQLAESNVLLRDAAGRPLHDGPRRYDWDGLGRLASVTQDGRTTAYRYNRLGLRTAKQGQVEQRYLYDDRRHRLAELDGRGRITREYVWLGDQLVAVIDPKQPQAMSAPADGTLAQIARSLRAAWASLSADAPRMTYVHINHLGAPVAMTDETAKPVWAADYAPFGQRLDADTGIVKTGGAHVSKAGTQGIRLDLRLPGQWEDEESGLYYNDQRYYDPVQGRYLSPDPLGLRGGLNAYAYASNNPLAYGDPLGLVLFAFDGTGNTHQQDWLDSQHSSLSNVWQFDQLYNGGNARYMSGVGTVQDDRQYGDIRPEDYSRGTLLGLTPGVSLERADMGGNYSGPVRIERMIQYFNDEADLAIDNEAMEVDIIGFSRGAAEARDFANHVVAQTRDGYYGYTTADGRQHCQRVDFRFMGLWDTVLSTNRTDHAYKLQIPDQFAYVAQAVALNEYRGDAHHAGFSSWGAFPLESIMPGQYSSIPQPGRTRVERGFLGAHADIGGGFGANENQLSQVALTWMVDQAKAAGVNMGDSVLLHMVIANPMVHDKSDSILTGAPRPSAEDRTVTYRDGSTNTQRQMAFSSGMSYPDTRQFINYFPRDSLSPEWQQHKNLFETGTVDMQGYLDWLNNNGYDIHMTAQ